MIDTEDGSNTSKCHALVSITVLLVSILLSILSNKATLGLFLLFLFYQAVFPELYKFTACIESIKLYRSLPLNFQ
jgi:hypothetical protein